MKQHFGCLPYDPTTRSKIDLTVELNGNGFIVNCNGARAHVMIITVRENFPKCTATHLNALNMHNIMMTYHISEFLVVQKPFERNVIILIRIMRDMARRINGLSNLNIYQISCIAKYAAMKNA